MDKPALKVAAIVIVAVLAPVAVVYVATDGASARDKTPANVSLPANPIRPETKAASAPTATNVQASADAIGEPAPTLTELEHLLAVNPGARDAVLRDTLPAMVAKDPEETARFAELQTDPQLRELLVRQTALLWAQTDSDRAMAWVRSLPDSPERVATLIDVSLSVAQTDPTRAISMREPDVGNVEPDGVLETLVQQWGEKDFDAALAWTNARPQNSQRDQLLRRLASVRAAHGAPNSADSAAINDWLEANGVRPSPDQTL